MFAPPVVLVVGSEVMTGPVEVSITKSRKDLGHVADNLVSPFLSVEIEGGGGLKVHSRCAARSERVSKWW